MLKTKSKPKAEAADSGAPDFSTAKARYDKALSEYEAKREAVEDAKAALLWENTAESDRATLAPAIRLQAAGTHPSSTPVLALRDRLTFLPAPGTQRPPAISTVGGSRDRPLQEGPSPMPS